MISCMTLFFCNGGVQKYLCRPQLYWCRMNVVVAYTYTGGGAAVSKLPLETVTGKPRGEERLRSDLKYIIVRKSFLDYSIPNLLAPMFISTPAACPNPFSFTSFDSFNPFPLQFRDFPYDLVWSELFLVNANSARSCLIVRRRLLRYVIS